MIINNIYLNGASKMSIYVSNNIGERVLAMNSYWPFSPPCIILGEDLCKKLSQQEVFELIFFTLKIQKHGHGKLKLMSTWALLLMSLPEYFISKLRLPKFVSLLGNFLLQPIVKILKFINGDKLINRIRAEEVEDSLSPILSKLALAKNGQGSIFHQVIIENLSINKLEDGSLLKVLVS